MSFLLDQVYQHVVCLTETSLREWVKLAEVDAGKGPAEALTAAEREELVKCDAT